MGRVLFLGNYGSPLSPPPLFIRHTHVQAAGRGAAMGELGQQHEAAPGWLWGWLCSRQRAVNSALLKMSNKGEKKRKEKRKGSGGSTGWEWGRQGLREQVGTI